MKDLKFDENKKGCGNTYGISVDLYKMKDIIDILYHAVKNKGLPMSSHHGQSFYLCRLKDISLSLSKYNNKLLFIFERQGWRTNFYSNKYGAWSKDEESTLTIKEKKALKRMFKDKGIKIDEAWNDKNEGNSVSIVVDGKFEFHELDKKINERQYKKKKKEFIGILNDFGGLAK